MVRSQIPLRCTVLEADVELGYHIRLLGCLHVHLLSLVSEININHYQVLEENSRPVTRSKGSSGLAGPARSYRVRTL